ncbi:MAG: hypothetical protein A3G35_10040 [candidate division NC10 bacterium RIFCSPLOWO2_12_FULL_66_18]|nr:MAG: hypothetical protein A3G35_10040 [candidate division NC10 bacterium RIFCSPLOWO2_12_FULL_66_18]
MRAEKRILLCQQADRSPFRRDRGERAAQKELENPQVGAGKRPATGARRLAQGLSRESGAQILPTAGHRTSGTHRQSR